MTIYERIKEVRKTLRYSQKEFATKLGVTRNIISNYEIGRVEPKQIFLDHLCQIFNVNKEWLKIGEGKMFNSNNEKQNINEEIVDKEIVDEVNLNNMIKKIANLDNKYLSLVANLINILDEAQEKKE